MAKRHLYLGFGAILLAGLLGLSLEAALGFRVPELVDADMHYRRALFRLGHAHLGLFGIVHVLVALCAHTALIRLRAWISWSLSLGLALLPSGFWLGGAFLVGVEPGIGSVLAPVGAVFLLCGVVGVLIVSRAERDSAASRNGRGG